MSSAYENAMSDLQANNYTQMYPVTATPLTPDELSRRYHCWLETYDEAIRTLEENMTTLTVAEFNYRFTSLQADRAALKAQWEREQDKA